MELTPYILLYNKELSTDQCRPPPCPPIHQSCQFVSHLLYVHYQFTSFCNSNEAPRICIGKLLMPLGNYCFENLVFKYSSSMCVKWWRISYVVSVLRSAGLLKCFNVGDCTTCNSCILHFLPETKTQLDRVGFDLHCLSIIENFAINDNKNNIIDNNIIPSNKNSNENNNNDNNKMRITCL